MGIALCMILASPVQAQHIVDEVAQQVVMLNAPQVTTAGKTTEILLSGPRLLEAFNGLIAEVETSDPDVRGWVRFEEDGVWGRWRRMQFFSLGDSLQQIASYRGDVYRKGVRFELLFTHDSSARVTVEEVGVFDNRKDEDHQDLSFGQLPTLLAKPSGRITVPDLIRRVDWGARPYNCSSATQQPFYTYLTLHHSAGTAAFSRDEGISTVQAIQDFHIDGRGWCDVGYQFLMDNEGRVYQGRPFVNDNVPFADGPALVIGAHVGGGNTGNIGVSVMGCYHPPEGSSCRNELTEAALDSVVHVFTYLADAYGVDPDNIRGHRDFNSTSCPGDNNYSLLDTIRARVRQNLRAPAGYAVAQASQTDNAWGEVGVTWTSTYEESLVNYQIVQDAAAGTNVFADVVALGGGTTYDVTFPAGSCDTTLSYFIDGISATGSVARSDTLFVTRPALAEGALAAELTQNGNVRLDWLIANDQGMDGYRLERVFDGNVEVVHTGIGEGLGSFLDVQAAGLGNTTYQLVAYEPSGCNLALAEAPVELDLPDSFRLLPAYPNPFNPTASIRYFLQESGAVELVVYNAAGQTVRTLVDGPQEGSRWYTVEVDAQGLPSGTYFYNLRVERASGRTFEDSGTLTLVK